eukprot:362909-Chlamydomonas_euryale.AAC.4
MANATLSTAAPSHRLAGSGAAAAAAPADATLRTGCAAGARNRCRVCTHENKGSAGFPWCRAAVAPRRGYHVRNSGARRPGPSRATVAVSPPRRAKLQRRA